jgi:hypothetical protein
VFFLMLWTSPLDQNWHQRVSLITSITFHRIRYIKTFLVFFFFFIQMVFIIVNNLPHLIFKTSKAFFAFWLRTISKLVVTWLLRYHKFRFTTNREDFIKIIIVSKWLRCSFSIQIRWFFVIRFGIKNLFINGIIIRWHKWNHIGFNYNFFIE